jgi:hypothetical protein
LSAGPRSPLRLDTADGFHLPTELITPSRKRRFRNGIGNGVAAARVVG